MDGEVSEGWMLEVGGWITALQVVEDVKPDSVQPIFLQAFFIECTDGKSLVVPVREAKAEPGAEKGAIGLSPEI